MRESTGPLVATAGTGFIIMMAIGALIGAICWPYAINHWLVYTGHEACITWWQGSLIGFVPYIGHLAIPVAVITWIIFLFI